MQTIVIVLGVTHRYSETNLSTMSPLSFRTVAQFFTVALLVLFTTLGTTVPAAADVVTLKTGEVIEGKIIIEGTDIVKIEVRVSGSIKETKTFDLRFFYCYVIW